MDKYIRAVEAAEKVAGAFKVPIADLVDVFAEIPAADVVPVVHGLWIPVRESEVTGWQPELAGRDPICGYVCSVCKEEATFDCNDEFVLSNYCPNCGAKMVGGADDETG